MTGRHAKRIKSHVAALRILKKQAKLIYGTGYLEKIPETGLLLNSFHKKVKAGTLTIDQINTLSNLFWLTPIDWYPHKEMALQAMNSFVKDFKAPPKPKPIRLKTTTVADFDSDSPSEAFIEVIVNEACDKFAPTLRKLQDDLFVKGEARLDLVPPESEERFGDLNELL